MILSKPRGRDSPVPVRHFVTGAGIKMKQQHALNSTFVDRQDMYVYFKYDIWYRLESLPCTIRRARDANSKLPPHVPLWCLPSVRNAQCKMIGRRNKYSMIYAFFDALAKHQGIESIARGRGKRILSLQREMAGRFA